MNIYAAIFLIPFSVVLYTSTGGLKVSLKASKMLCCHSFFLVSLKSAFKVEDTRAAHRTFTKTILTDCRDYPESTHQACLKYFERQKWSLVCYMPPWDLRFSASAVDFCLLIRSHSRHLHSPSHLLVRHRPKKPLALRVALRSFRDQSFRAILLANV